MTHTTAFPARISFRARHVTAAALPGPALCMASVLTEDLLLRILSELHDRELANMARVCQQFRRLRAEAQDVLCGEKRTLQMAIEFTTGPAMGKVYPIDSTGATVGRGNKKSGEGNRIQILDEEMSGVHAQVHYRDADRAFYMKDSGSTNGTFRRFSREKDTSEPQEITKGALYRLGQTELEVKNICVTEVVPR